MEVTGLVELDADVLFLLREEEVAAEDVGDVGGAGFGSTGKLKGILERDAVGIGEGARDGFAHESGYGDIGRFGEVVFVKDVEFVTRLQFEVVGTGQLQPQVFLLLGIVGVEPDHIGNGVGVNLQSAGHVDGLPYGEVVGDGEALLEGSPHMANDRNVGHIGKGGYGGDRHLVAGLKPEDLVGVSQVEQVDRELLFGQVGALPLHEYQVEFGLRGGLGIADQDVEGGVGVEVEAAGIEQTPVDVDILFDGLVVGSGAYDVAILQRHHRLAGEYFGEVPLLKPYLPVGDPFDLHVVGVGVHVDAPCIFNQVGEGLFGQHFVAHRPFDGSLDPHQLLCHRYEEDVVLLQVELVLHGRIAHEGVEVDVFPAVAPDVLDVAHRTNPGRSTGSREGVEGGVEGGDAEAPGGFGLTEDIDQHGTGGHDGYGKLVG